LSPILARLPSFQDEAAATSLDVRGSCEPVLAELFAKNRLQNRFERLGPGDQGQA
jgi:hypothetical protein